MHARIEVLPFNPASLAGFSEQLLNSHHQNNYAGAVKRLNAIRDELSCASFAKLPGYQLNGLKREELIATNSMLLHELYFSSLGGAGKAMEPACELALAASFGSAARWREEFIAMGKALGGGSGWVLLVFQPREGTLVNQWSADHTHALAGGVPILALDMYEHAYHLDFGAAAATYVDAFMQQINWSKVYERYQHAVHSATEHLGVDQDGTAGALLFDVRRAGVFQQASKLIAGAQWLDPMAVAAWSVDVPTEREVVVYCVYGHEVSRVTALRLHAAGVRAKYLNGGFDAWAKAGRALEDKS